MNDEKSQNMVRCNLIYEQLRSVKGVYCDPPAPYTSTDIVTLMHDAADEIERLRAALEHISKWHPERGGPGDVARAALTGGKE